MCNCLQKNPTDFLQTQKYIVLLQDFLVLGVLETYICVFINVTSQLKQLVRNPN